MRDLQPYVCTFKDCSLRLFSSRHEWFEHELVMHRKFWRCNKCIEECRSADDFREHLDRNHPGSFSTDNQLKILTIQCEHAVLNVSPSDCPLCDEWEISLTGSNAGIDNLVTIDNFKKHLGKHLERLALFALPRLSGEEESDDTNSGVAENVSEGGLGLSVDPTSASPHIPLTMDPLTIARSAVSLVKGCRELCLFFKTVREGDPTIQALVQEMQGLQSALETVAIVAESALVANVVAHQWESTHSVIYECKDTLTNLTSALGDPTTNHHQRDFLRRSWRQFKTEMISGDIAALQSKISSHRRTLSLSIQVIIL